MSPESAAHGLDQVRARRRCATLDLQLRERARSVARAAAGARKKVRRGVKLYNPTVFYSRRGRSSCGAPLRLRAVPQRLRPLDAHLAGYGIRNVLFKRSGIELPRAGRWRRLAGVVFPTGCGGVEVAPPASSAALLGTMPHRDAARPDLGNLLRARTCASSARAGLPAREHLYVRHFERLAEGRGSAAPESTEVRRRMAVSRSTCHVRGAVRFAQRVACLPDDATRQGPRRLSRWHRRRT